MSEPTRSTPPQADNVAASRSFAANRSPATATQVGWLIALAVVGLVLVAAPVLFGSQEKWEYKVEAPSDYGLTEKLNRLGAQGWEVVSARRASDGSSYSPTFSYEIIFKRRVSVFSSGSSD